MLRLIAKLVVGLVLVLAVIGIVFFAGMRTKFPPLLKAVRRMNRRFVNPRNMRTAGSPGAYASVVGHVGRTTGRPYQTPVQAVATDDGFVIGLPYGSQADWLKNVLASGSATIVYEGNTYSVDRPEVVGGAAAASYFPPKDQRTHRIFGLDEFLRVRRAGPSGTARHADIEDDETASVARPSRSR